MGTFSQQSMFLDRFFHTNKSKDFQRSIFAIVETSKQPVNLNGFPGTALA